MFRSSLALAALAAMVLSVQPAQAQPPAGYNGPPLTYPMFPTGINPSKAGTQVQQFQYRFFPAAVALAATVTAPVPPRPVVLAPVVPAELAVVVAVSEPAAGPLLVDLRGPAGDVRSFRVTGGSDAIRVRNFVLHPGDRLTLNFQNPGRQTRNVQ